MRAAKDEKSTRATRDLDTNSPSTFFGDQTDAITSFTTLVHSRLWVLSARPTGVAANYRRLKRQNNRGREFRRMELGITRASPSRHDTHWPALTEVSDEMCAASRQPATARLRRTITGLKSVLPTQLLRRSSDAENPTSKCAKMRVFIYTYSFSRYLHCAYNKTNMRNINLLHKGI